MNVDINSVLEGMSDKELEELNEIAGFLLSNMNIDESDFEDKDGLSHGMYEIPNDLRNFHGATSDTRFRDMLDRIEAKKAKNVEANKMNEVKEARETRDPKFGDGFNGGSDTGVRLPVNISKRKDGSVIYLQTPVAGYTADEIEVNLHMENGGYVVEMIGSPVDDPIEDDAEDTIDIAKEFTIQPFTTKVTIPKEAYDGKYNVDLGNGLLTIAFILTTPVTTTKNIF